jgi:hypothetical protein
MFCKLRRPRLLAHVLHERLYFRIHEEHFSERVIRQRGIDGAVRNQGRYHLPVGVYLTKISVFLGAKVAHHGPKLIERGRRKAGDEVPRFAHYGFAA